MTGVRRWAKGTVTAVVLSMWLVLPASSQDEPIAATVDNTVITLADVDGLLARTFDDRPVNAAVQQLLRAESLRQMIGQVLIVNYLAEQGTAAGEADVQLHIEKLEQQLRAVGQTLDDYLERQKQSRNAMSREIRFRLSWEKYLQTMLTDDNLQQHFEKNRWQLDGTRLHVRHILWGFTDDSKVDVLVRRAELARSRITSGELAWETAVLQYSTAPSAQNHGDLGWIERHAPMPEAFSRAAFELEPGELSDPVVTQFGVHLIQCLEVEAGEGNWSDYQERVRSHATQFLFDWICEKQMTQSSIRFTAHCPHWNEQRELVTGENLSATSDQ